tara:strand:+ start:205 stop:819 length:615 start_codon:yes stop_codon:yes gene_type:complete
MKVRELLGKATKLKKANKVKEAIKILEEAYTKGTFVSISEETDDYIDNPIYIRDLVRKAKYLQKIGKANEALQYLDKLIPAAVNAANRNFWYIQELSDLYNDKAIILMREKRFDEEFVMRMKSYCLDGILCKIKSNSKDKYLSERFIPIYENIVSPVEIEKYIERKIKKTSFEIDKKVIANKIIEIISLNFSPKKISNDLSELF